MKSAKGQPQPPRNLEGLRSVLFSSAKRWWFGGVGAGFLAIVVVPIASASDVLKSIDTTFAALLAILGKVLRSCADAIRVDADRLQRANELSVGVGFPVNSAMVADVKYRYSRLAKVAEQQEANQQEYYSASGDPSPHLLVSMLRESAWWTARLAGTMECIIYTVAGIGFMASLLTLLIESTSKRFYGMAICSILLADLIQLGWRYHKTKSACDCVFKEFDSLSDCDVTERDAVLTATDYHMVRSTGPLLPDWLWKMQRKKLQDAWLHLEARRG